MTRQESSQGVAALKMAKWQRIAGILSPSPLPLSHKGRGELVLFNISVKLTISKITKIFL